MVGAAGFESREALRRALSPKPYRAQLSQYGFPRYRGIFWPFVENTQLGNRTRRFEGLDDLSYGRRQRRAMNASPVSLLIEWKNAMHRAPIVPKQKIADLPFMRIDESFRRRMGKQILN